MKIIEKAIAVLLNTQPFYAHFFLNSKIEYDKYNVPTAGAAVTPTCTIIVFNTQFVETLSVPELVAVIEHEVLHILFEHTTQFAEQMRAPGGYSKEVSNIAMDLAINQFIQNLPEDCVDLGRVEAMIGKKLLPQQDWEYYYTILMNDLKKLGKLTPHDDHGAAIPGQCKPGEAKEVMKSTMDSAVRASRGNLPEHVLKVYDSCHQEPVLPWQQILANFVARSTSSIVKNTRKKTNRRFGIDQPGKIKKRQLTLGVCVDSSGSISDESYKAFMGEIERISKLCGTTYVIDADCEVQNVQKVSKQKPLKKERHGNGGTAYTPAIQEAVKLKCDAIVYLGDGDCADVPTDPGKPFLWVLVGGQEPPGKFGQVLRL